VFDRSAENAASWERRFDIPMLLVAALVLPSMLLDQPGVKQPWRGIGVALDWGIWTAFTVELIVMLLVVPNRWRYLLRNPIDVIVVLLTPPFLTSLFDGVRALRLVRLLRLLRLEPLVRWLFRSGGLKYAAAFTSLVVLAAAEAFSVVEKTSYFDGLYWSVTTMTTVGYGDQLPTTDEAKVMAMFVMVVGIGFFAALAGALADHFIEGRANEVDRVDQLALEADPDQSLLARIDAISRQLDELREAVGERGRSLP
jgi:voltage-gated potassium channel